MATGRGRCVGLCLAVGGCIGTGGTSADTASPVESLGASGTLTGLEISPQVGLLFKVRHLTIGPIAELILVDYSAKESICSGCSGWNAWGSLALRVGWM